jgi:hypothetical protein
MDFRTLRQLRRPPLTAWVWMLWRDCRAVSVPLKHQSMPRMDQEMPTQLLTSSSRGHHGLCSLRGRTSFYQPVSLLEGPNVHRVPWYLDQKKASQGSTKVLGLQGTRLRGIPLWEVNRLDDGPPGVDSPRVRFILASKSIPLYGHSGISLRARQGQRGLESDVKARKVHRNHTGLAASPDCLV